MPTYVYACTSCGERIEAVQRITDEPLTTCQVCSGALRKVFQPVGVVFKGSGFYKTDSRSSSSASSPAKPESKSDTKSSSESKPASSGSESCGSSTSSGTASTTPKSGGSSTGSSGSTNAA